MTDDSIPQDTLFDRVFAELKSLARQQMSRERADHTLQATALVSEVWIRLRDQLGDAGSDPSEFYAAAVESMRRILIEHARRRGRKKRGGGLTRMPLDLATVAETADVDEVLALDGAIEQLRGANQRAAQIVRLRFFAGLTETAAADVLGISERTARREWTFARAWLFDRLNPG